MNEYREIIEKDNGFIARELDFIDGVGAVISGGTDFINKEYDI